MRKIHTKIIAAFAILCAAASCMPEAPIDAVHPENYFQNASALQNWISYCYKEFDSQDAMLLDADDFVSAHPCEVLSGSRMPATQTWDWSVLRQASQLLENTRYCKDEEAVARYEAEAHFFRALFYFNKVRQWGDACWFKSTPSAEDAKFMRRADARDKVLDAAFEEMDQAAEELTDDIFEVPVRINKWVAKGFAARADLYEGTFLKYSGESDWEEYLETAVKLCEDIMNSGLFEVYSAPAWKSGNAYRNLFAMETMSPKEALMVRILNTSDCTSKLDRIYRVENLGATARFGYHYQMINGASITKRSGYETETLDEVSQGRDPRMAQTLWMPGTKELDSGEPMPYEGSVTGYQPIKFRKTADATSLAACFPLLRYSEILLTYAEAKAELGTLKQADLDKSVNLIRARVGMPALSMSDANSAPDALLAGFYPNVDKGKNKGIILEIRRERTVEMALEGQRLWDMLRWHEGAQLGNRKAPINGIYDGTGFIVAHKKTPLPEEEWDEDRDYLWPIPASELAVPGCGLRQNFGY